MTPTPDEREEQAIAETQEKAFPTLANFANRMEAVKVAHRALVRNESTMSSLEVSQALGSIYNDLEALIAEAAGYAKNRGKRKTFVHALHAAAERAEGDRDAEITAIWQTIQVFAELFGLLLTTAPPDVDYSAEIKQQLIDAAIEKGRYRRIEPENDDGVASEVDEQ